MENYHKRFSKMKKYLGHTNKDISEITGLKPSSITNQTQPSKDFPRWLKYTLEVFEKMKKE